MLVLPTGLGKTSCAAELARRYVEERGERVLFLAHTEELIDQAADEIAAKGFGGDSHIVGVEMAQRSVDLSGLYAPQVVVASVPTMCREPRLFRFEPDTFGLIIIDEAHRSVAATYRRVIDYFRGTTREDGVVTGYTLPTHLLGLTATPDRRDSRALSDVFATVAYRYEIREAIHEGYLVPIVGTTGVLPRIDLSNVRMLAGDFRDDDLDEAVTAMLDEAGIALADRVGTRKTIAFLPSVDSAVLFADVLKGLGLTAEALSGRDHKTDRRNVVQAFRDGDFQVLCNCELFTYGFNVPDVSCIANLRPTTSRALYSQIIGRGTRTAAWAGKTDCLLIDFPGVGFDGKKGHKLVTPQDALGGVTDEDILRRAREKAELLAEQGVAPDLLDLLDDAESEITEEREERARQIKARRAQSEQQLDLLGSDPKTEPAWRRELRDVWGLWDGTQPRKKNEIPADEAAGLRIIAKCKERKREGLCTWPQARTLRKFRLPTTRVDKHTASDWISAIAAVDWRDVPAHVRLQAASYWPGDAKENAK